MSRVQATLAALLLATALIAGSGVYMSTRPARIPDGFVLMDLTGAPRSLAEFRGQTLIVNFWATWCPPCRREIPLLKELQASYAAQGVTVVGIAVEEPTPVRKLADEIGFNYPILIGEQEAYDLAGALGIEVIGLPYTVFIDARGRVQHVHSGELHREDAELALARLLP